MKQTVLVTGGSRGLGLAAVLHLAQAGWNVAISDLSELACNVYGEMESIDALLEKVSSMGAQARFYKADLTLAANAEELVSSVARDFGSIDALVGLAGGDIRGLDDRAAGGKATNNTAFASEEDFQSIFKRNFETGLHSCRAAGSRMKEQGRGRIVTVASVAAGFGVTKETAYAVGKAALVHFTRCLAAELRPFGVNVNCIAPGATNTGRFRATLKDRTPEDLIRLKGSGRLERLAEPEDVCKVIEFFLSPAADFVSGQVLRVDGGQFTSPF